MDNKKRFGYIISAFRKIWRWSPERKQVLEASRSGARYRCAGCRKQFVRDAVKIDHIEPVIDPAKGFQGWDAYYNRLFVPTSKLQVLCDKCHNEKTAEERKRRKNG